MSKLVLKNIVGVLGSSPLHFGSGGFAWILSLLKTYQYNFTVYLSFHFKKKRGKKIKMKRGWYLTCWVDQQTAVLHQECIGTTVASYSHVHPWTLCAGCQGLRAISFLFLFESPSQPSKSPPLFLAFDISACFYTINPLSSASQEPLLDSLKSRCYSVCCGTIQRKTQNALTKWS